MAWKAFELQPFLSLSGTDVFPIMQDHEAWARLGDFPGGVLDVQIAFKRDVVLFVEGSDAVAGPWSTIQSFGTGVTTANEQFFLDRDAVQGSPDRLPLFVRWRLENVGTDWTVLFKLSMIVRD